MRFHVDPDSDWDLSAPFNPPTSPAAGSDSQEEFIPPQPGVPSGLSRKRAHLSLDLGLDDEAESQRRLLEEAQELAEQQARTNAELIERTNNQQQQLHQKDQTIAFLRSQVAALELENQTIRKDAKDQEEKHAQAQRTDKETIGKLAQEALSSHGKIKRLKHRNAELKSDCEELKQEIEKQKEIAAQLKQAKLEMAARLKQAKLEITAHTKKAIETQRIIQLEDQIADLTAERKQQSKALERSNAELAKTNRALDAVKVLYNEKEATAAQLQHHLNTAGQEIASLRRDIETLRKEKEDLKQRIERPRNVHTPYSSPLRMYSLSQTPPLLQDSDSSSSHQPGGDDFHTR